MTPFRSEKNTNWEGAYRVPAMVRWPGQIKPGSVSNEIVSHLDWLPTLLAIAGDTDVKEKLLKGYKVGDTTYKVHLDGYNLVPYLTGQADEEPARVVPLLHRRAATGRPALRQLEDRVHGAAGPGHDADLGRTVHQPAGAEDVQPAHGPVRAGRHHVEHVLRLADRSAFLMVPAQAYVGEFLATFKEFPPRQKADTFNLDAVLRKMERRRRAK